MKRKLQALALATLTTLLVLAPSVEAQTRRRIDQRGSFQPPGTRIWITPAPQWEYRFGGVRIYPGRNKGYNYWPYGAPQGYQWPYGYPQNYDWPYSNNNAWPQWDQARKRRR